MSGLDSDSGTQWTTSQPRQFVRLHDNLVPALYHASDISNFIDTTISTTTHVDMPACHREMSRMYCAHVDHRASWSYSAGVRLVPRSRPTTRPSCNATIANPYLLPERMAEIEEDPPVTSKPVSIENPINVDETIAAYPDIDHCIPATAAATATAGLFPSLAAGLGLGLGFLSSNGPCLTSIGSSQLAFVPMESYTPIPEHSPLAVTGTFPTCPSSPPLRSRQSGALYHVPNWPVSSLGARYVEYTSEPILPPPGLCGQNGGTTIE